LKEIARGLGADLVGIADLACLKDIDTEPADLRHLYQGLSLGPQQEGKKT
jgi:hypothetical protein